MHALTVIDGASSAPVPRTAGVRPFTADDAAAVSAMFNRTFRGDDKAGSPALEEYLPQLFLDHPWSDPGLAARVHVSQAGEVNGFIGIMPVRMVFNSRRVSAAQAGSLMVRDPTADPLAGARLLRTFFTGPQELSFSETSNPISQRMWERLGGDAVPVYSLEWVRVLRPAGLAVALLGDRLLTRPLRPMAALADKLARAVGIDPFRLASEVGVVAEDATDDALIATIIELATGYALRPQWDAASLAQFLAHAATKRRHGPLERAIVRDARGQVVGCFLYYGRPGGIAYVLQVLARRGAGDGVVDAMLAHAAARGCVAIRGRSDPKLQDSLARRRAVFLHRSSLTVHTRDPQLLAAVRAGDALLTGLAGESWSRLIGDAFDA